MNNIDANNIVNTFNKSDDLIADLCGIIETTQKVAHQTVNTLLVQRNWLLGFRIASEELNGEDRAEYGARLIKKTFQRIVAEIWEGIHKNQPIQFLFFL